MRWSATLQAESDYHWHRSDADPFCKLNLKHGTLVPVYGFVEPADTNTYAGVIYKMYRSTAAVFGLISEYWLASPAAAKCEDQNM